MLTLSHGLPADLIPNPRRAGSRYVQAPAADFWHEGKLNMGPAICLTLTLSVLGWTAILGAAFLLCHLS